MWTKHFGLENDKWRKGFTDIQAVGNHLSTNNTQFELE